MRSESPAEAEFLALVDSLPGPVKAPAKAATPARAKSASAPEWLATFVRGPDGAVDAVVVAPDDGVGNPWTITPSRDEFGRAIYATIRRDAQ